MKNTLLDIYEKEGTKKVLASLISILVGLVVGAIVVVIVGLTKNTITNQGIADGVKLIFAGILCTGRNAAGQLSWGFHDLKRCRSSQSTDSGIDMGVWATGCEENTRQLGWGSWASGCRNHVPPLLYT